MKNCIDDFAEAAGSTGPALRLAITLFSAYGLAAVYRWKICHKPPLWHHIFFIVSGLSLMLFNYGRHTYHSLIGIFTAYLICKIFGRTPIAVLFSFIFYMTYLLLGFHFTPVDEYDLTWTLPQCILTLRLISLVADYYDGGQPNADPKTVINDCPSLIEITSYTYFFGSFIVGPQYPLKRFRDFVEGRFDVPYVGPNPLNRFKPSFTRLILGLVYMAIHVILFTFFYPTEYFLTDDFKQGPLLWKILTSIIWLRAILFRYQAVWLLTEGSCILSGLAYNGRDENGEIRWDAVRNIRMVKFEFGCSFQSIIDSFNYNTNLWAARYVFKRLRFLGNKTLSHVMTLFFLSLWHGFHSGYYACFGFEFACVFAERKIVSFFESHFFNSLMRTPELLFPVWFVKKLFVLSCCGFGLIPFGLLYFHLWIEVYKSMYFIGWLTIGGILLADPLFKKGGKRKPE